MPLLTFNWLFRVEIIAHGSDRGAQRLDAADDGLYILQIQPSRSVRMISLEFLQIVSPIPTNVNEKRSIARSVGTVHEPALNGVDGAVHPWRTTLPIACHVVIEMGTVPLGLQPAENI